MKILYVCRAPILPGTVVETHALGFASAWKDAGHEVTMWTPVSPADPRLGWRPLAVSRPRSLSAGFWGEGIAAGRPDLVYARWCVAEGPALARACAAAEVPLVVEVNGILEEEMNGASLLRKGWVRWCESETVRGAAGAVVPTEGVREHLVRRRGAEPARVHVAGNGVDPDLFRPMDKAECRRKLGLDPSLRYLVYVGSLRPWHGVEDLLMGEWGTLGHEDLGILIVGDGPRREELQRYAAHFKGSERVRWSGAVPRAEVPVWIGAADLCACLFRPVRSDPGSAVKLYEYMACGRPVVATDVPEYADPVRAAACGWLAKAGSHMAVVEAVQSGLLATDAERDAMGRRARAWAVEHRTWRKVADGVLGFAQKAGGRDEGSGTRSLFRPLSPRP